MLANVDYSAETRARAIAWLRAHRTELAGMPEDARLTVAVGLLVADKHGRASMNRVNLAATDPSAMQAARALLAQAEEATP